MPLDPKLAQNFIRSQQFKNLEPADQLDAAMAMLRDQDESFNALDSEVEKRRMASLVINEFEPGFLEKAADWIPVVGETVKAVRSPEETRPLTRKIITGLLGEEALQDPTTRGVVEGARALAENIGLIAISGGVGNMLFGPAAKAAVPLGLRAIGAATGKEAASLGAQAGRAAFMARVSRAAAEGATDLGLFTLGTNVERVTFGDEQLNVFRHLLLEPAISAAMGAVLGGAVPAVMRQFTNEGKKLATGLAKFGRISREESVDIVTRGLKEPLSPEEFGLFRAALRSDPSLLENTPARHILAQNIDHMKPRIDQAASKATPNTVLRVQTRKGLQEIVDPDEGTFRMVLRDIEQGNAFVQGLSGPNAEARLSRVHQAMLRYQERLGNATTSPTDFENLPVGFFTDSNISDIDKQVALARISASRGGQVASNERALMIPGTDRPPVETAADIFQNTSVDTQAALLRSGGRTLDLPQVTPLEQRAEGILAGTEQMGGAGRTLPTPLEDLWAPLAKEPLQLGQGTVAPELVAEQVRSSLPESLRLVARQLAEEAPEPRRIEPALGPAQKPALGAKQPGRLFVEQAMEAIDTVNPPKITPAFLAKHTDIPTSQAAALKKQLIDEGLITPEGKPRPRAAAEVPAKPTPAPLPPTGTVVRQATGELGEVLDNNGVHAVVRTSDGAETLAVPLANGTTGEPKGLKLEKERQQRVAEKAAKAPSKKQTADDMMKQINDLYGRASKLPPGDERTRLSLQADDLMGELKELMNAKTKRNAGAGTMADQMRGDCR